MAGDDGAGLRDEAQGIDVEAVVGELRDDATGRFQLVPLVGPQLDAAEALGEASLDRQSARRRSPRGPPATAEFQTDGAPGSTFPSDLLVDCKSLSRITAVLSNFDGYFYPIAKATPRLCVSCQLRLRRWRNYDCVCLQIKRRLPREGRSSFVVSFEDFLSWKRKESFERRMHW